MPKTLQEYSINAAQSFIQTAVFIDDRIYQPNIVDTAKPKTIPPPTHRPRVANTATRANIDGTGNTNDPQEEDIVSDISDIVSSFAEKQIVCSMYQPTNAPMKDQQGVIVSLCAAADVVIIDWDLFGDSGDRSLELINMLITQASQDVPEQLRLILVYTQELDLASVGEKILETVNSDIGEEFQLAMDGSKHAFYNKNSRVTVLGKPRRQRPETDCHFVVEEPQLACVAVEEFAKLAFGILQAASLLGLAEIRNNSRKILSRFNRDLDPAFLTHRAMGLGTEDALSHIVPLLVSEIESVLEDALPNPLISEDVLGDWCMNVWEPGDHLDQLLGGKKLDKRKIASDICTKGFEDAEIDLKLNSSKNIKRAGQILLPSNDSEANLRFAHFMANRTFYGNKEKMLTLGSILHDREQDQFFLCIQPVCDSVRLKNQRSFMFVKMHKKISKPNNPISHVVIKPDNSIIEVVYQANSYHCFLATFMPDGVFKQIIASENSENDENEFFFGDICGRKYYWIGQLRASHAQDAVERFSGNISRVGLTESEWLRLLAKK